MKSWFAGTASSVNSEIITPFSNAEQIIYKYNQAIEHNSLTQQGWQRLIAQCDDGLASYLTNIKGSAASMSAYSVSLQGNITGYTKITQAMKQYNALGAVSQKEQQNFATAVSLTNTKLGSYLTGLNGAKASLSGYGVSLIASTAKTVGLTIATTALNAALTFGISTIITGVVSAFAAWINSSKKITEAAEEAKNKISSINDDLKTNTETVENAKQRYAELAQEVENLGKVNQSRGSLSTDEYEDFLDLSNQLAGVFPQLTKGYDDNGNAILDLSGNVDTIVGSLDDLLQKEKDLANQKIMDEFPDVYKGYVKDLDKAESEVKSAKSEFDKINNAYQQLQNSGGAAQAFDLQGNGTFENADGEQVKVTLAEYEQALKDLGIEYEKTNIMVKNQFGGDTLSGYLINATGDIDTAFTNKLETAKKNLDYAKQQLEGETSSISSYLNTWLQTEFTYNQIDDAGLQTAVQDMIMNFDFSNLPENVDKDNWNEVSEYLRRNILFAINDVQDDPEISKAISEVFANQDLTSEEKANYLQQIKDYFDDLLGKDNAISISLQPQIDDTDALQKSIEKTADKFNDSDKIKDFFDTECINTDEEVNDFNKVTEGINDADKAIQAWNEHKKASEETPISTPTFSDTVSSLKDLKDQLSDLDTIMASFVSGDDIDVSNFDNIINKFTELKEAGKDIDMSSVEDAINQIGNSSSIEEAQSSLDSLCQQYINASGILDNLTESNAGFVQSQLEQIGVSNAAEIVTNSLAAEQNYLAWAKDNSAASSANLADMTSVEMAALLADANVTDEAKASMYNYWVAKGNVLDLGAITTDGDISNLSGLCSALGIATKQCETFAKAKSLLAAAVQSNDLTAIAGYAGQIAGLQASITTQISATLGSKSNSNYSPKYGGGSSTKKAYEDAAKDAKKSADKAKDNAEKAAEEARQKAEAELDAYLKYQEAMLDANEITVSQYADAVSDRLTEMFENGEISASKFYSGVETMCKKQLDIYDKVKDVVVRRYDKEIDKIQETMDAIDEQNEALNKQKDIMDKQLQYVKAMEEVEIDKLTREKEAYEKENEAYEKQKDTMDKAVSYATTLIDKKIEKINDESDALDKLSEKYDQQQTDYQNMLSGIDKVYDDRIDELNKQSDAIQDQIDKIQDENSELDLQYRKEQALYALSKAQNQRTKKLYVKGRGIIYTQDDEAIRDAKKDLKDIETEEVVSKLNKEKQAIADQIEEVQKWKDKWSEISNAYQEKINNELLVNHFGTDYVNKILSGNITDYNDFKNAYLNIQAKIDDVSEQKKALEEELDAWNKKKDAWSKVTDAAQNEENKQAAIQQWGKDYAKIILDARQNDLQNFETNYLFINDRINDNQGAIDSLDEIINIHEQRKQNYEDLTTAMENEELKRELDRELGRTWEKDTLNASEIDWETWKQKYLDIQDQLNNNDKLKESYEEKKNELDTWKQKWSDATSSIQNSINDQYAAQILGQNWESNIFTDRQKNLTNFTNAYVSLYQKQADAAINAANAEVTAAKNARAEIASSSTSVDNGSSTGSSGYSTGGGGGGGSSTPKPKERSDKYWTFQYFGGGYSSEAAAKKHMGDYVGANGTTKYGSQYFVVKWLQGCETSAIAANYVKSLRATAKKNKYNYVKRFHSGLELGRISKTNGEDFNTVQRVGTQGLKSDEVPIIAQSGEAVVTEKQIENLAEAIDYIPVYQEILDKISEVANAGKMDEVAKMIPKAKYDTPKPKEVTQNNQTINVTQDINVNCPNVTNTTGAEYLVKALRKASADVLVYNK